MEKDYESIIKSLKEDYEKAKDKKIRAEAKLEQLNKAKEELIKDIEKLGIKPEEMESEIEKLEKELNELVLQAKNILSGM